MFKKLYRVYDFILTRLNLPIFFCSQCERKIRHWVYHFNGLTYCQGCADVHVVELEDNSLFRF